MGAAHESTMKAAVITSLLLVVAILVIIGFSSKIRRSLKVVTNRIEWLAQGDLKTPTEIVETKDETQVLSVKLNDTITAINQYISQLSDILSSCDHGCLHRAFMRCSHKITARQNNGQIPIGAIDGNITN